MASLRLSPYPSLHLPSSLCRPSSTSLSFPSSSRFLTIVSKDNADAKSKSNASSLSSSASSTSSSETLNSTGSKFRTSSNASIPSNSVEEQESAMDVEEEYEDDEGEETWLEEKLGDAYDLASSAMVSVPGPRVASSEVPWLIAVPAGYLVLTFVWSVVRLIQKYNTPKAKRRRQIGKNALLCETLDEYLPEKRDSLTSKELRQLEQQCGFTTDEVLRKYVRYALNERPFGPELVADLVHLRKVSALEDKDVAELLNEVSRRVVKAKGPIVMDTTGMTEKGIKRKASVQGIFTKLFYLSTLEDFCSSSAHDLLKIKSAFGITDEDAESIKIETLTGTADIDSLEKLMTSKPVAGGNLSEDEEDDSEADL